MKKVFLSAVFVFLLLSLFGLNMLKDVYHKDYGYIDRVVFVFAKTPEFEVVQNRKDIQINIRNCEKAPELKSREFPANKVLEDFTIAAYGNNMIAIVMTDSTYVLKHFSLREKNNFKLVLDIFGVKQPETYEEYLSFGNFYRTVGYPKKAAFFLHEAEKHKNEIVQKVEIDTLKQVLPVDTTTVTEKLAEQNKPVSEKLPPQKKKIDKDKIIILFVAIVLFNLIVIIVRKLWRKKKSISEIKESGFRSTAGFGSKEFQKRMVKKLAEKRWENREIALELNLSEDEIKKMRKEMKI